MSTVREMFREAMTTQDWGIMCDVYEAITGEAAPDVVVASVDVLDQEMAMTTTPENPLDREMEDSPPPEAEGDPSDLMDSGDEYDTYDRGVSQAQVGGVHIPDVPPPDDIMSEFYIQHGTQQGSTNDEGETQCRKESMRIPQARKNRFRDNGKAFADEKVTAYPNDPKLGIQSIRPRGLIRDEDMGLNTGALVPVICKLCGKQETVASRLSVGYHTDPEHNTYKCNNCNTPNGRAKVMRAARNANMNNQAPRRGKDTQQRR